MNTAIAFCCFTEIYSLNQTLRAVRLRLRRAVVIASLQLEACPPA